MSPVTRLARLNPRKPRASKGDEFCRLFIWEISARLTGMKFLNKTKMAQHKVVSFAIIVALSTLVILLIKLI